MPQLFFKILTGLVTTMITSMIFFPEKAFYEKPEDYDLEYQDVNLVTSDDVKLHGWFLESKKEFGPTILFLHGNAGNISGRLQKAKGWVERGFAVFLLDYRSYGKSEGVIDNESDLETDSDAAWRWLHEKKKIPEKNIILYGESLGSYPAIQLATKKKSGALILEAPFTSFLDLASKHYPMIPGKGALLQHFKFANLDSIEKIGCPVFILHGTEDEICPYAMSGDLFDRAPEPKAFFSIPDGAHNDLPYKAGADFWHKPHEFLQRHLVTDA